MTLSELRQALPRATAIHETLGIVADHLQREVEASVSEINGIISQQSIAEFKNYLESEALRLLYPHCVYALQIARLERAGNGLAGFEMDALDKQDRSRWPEAPMTLDPLCQTVLQRIDWGIGNWQRGITRYLAWRSTAYQETPTKIETGIFEGETHNQGKFLFRISDDLGNAYVYKPVSLRSARAVSDVISEIISPGLREAMKVAEMHPVGEDFGFVAFLPTENRARSDGEVKRFYRVLGAWVAISHCLRMPDMHFENILVNGCLPIVVDLETAFYRSFYIGREGWDLLTSGLLSLHRSAGVFGGGRVQVRRTGVTMQSAGNIVMNYRQQKTADQSRLYCQDKWATPLDNVASLKAGFEDCFTVIMDRAGDILSYLEKESAREPIPIRCVLRYTWDYIIMGQWSIQPSLNGEGLNKVRERCAWNDIEERAMLPLVSESEIRDIESGDVPYFHSNYSDRHLYHWSGMLYADHFDMSGAEMMTRHFSLLSSVGCPRYLADIDAWALEASELVPKMTNDGEGINA